MGDQTLGYRETLPPKTPPQPIAQGVKDPHILERERTAKVEHTRAGKLKVTGTPMKFSRTPCKIHQACPDVGQDTDETLKNLGML
ncbi:MAG: CoA transferase [Planctomycetaceae bacterium]